MFSQPQLLCDIHYPLPFLLLYLNHNILYEILSYHFCTQSFSTLLTLWLYVLYTIITVNLWSLSVDLLLSIIPSSFWYYQCPCINAQVLLSRIYSWTWTNWPFLFDQGIVPGYSGKFLWIRIVHFAFVSLQQASTKVLNCSKSLCSQDEYFFIPS